MLIYSSIIILTVRPERRDLDPTLHLPCLMLCSHPSYGNKARFPLAELTARVDG